MAATKRDCPLCGEELEDAPAVHDVAKCENTELLKGRETIKKLKESVSSWKDAWFHLREIIGNLWWHHPAIDNDEQRVYYQNHLRNISEVNKRIANGKCTNLSCVECNTPESQSSECQKEQEHAEEESEQVAEPAVPRDTIPCPVPDGCTG